MSELSGVGEGAELQATNEALQEAFAPTLWSRLAGWSLQACTLFVLFLLGGWMVRSPVLGFLALGYMFRSMAKRIHRSDDLMGSFWGQEVLSSWVALALAMGVVVLGPVFLSKGTGVGLFGLLVVPGFGLALLGLMASFRGGGAVYVFQPRRAWRLLRAPRESTWGELVLGAWRGVSRCLLAVWETWLWGVRGFLGTLLWLALPSFLLALGWSLGWILSFERVEYGYIYFMLLMMFVGLVGLGLMAAWLPMATAHYAATGDWRSMFDTKGIWERIGCVPVRYGVSLIMTVLLMVPLYLFRIPRLTPKTLGFLAFSHFAMIALVKLMWAGVYARSLGGEVQSQRWKWVLGWTLATTAGILFASLTLAAQFISWRGPYGFFDHMTFLLPIPG